MRTFTLTALTLTLAAGCMERCATNALPALQSTVRVDLPEDTISRVDLLLSVDNSSSMAGNGANLARNLGRMVDQLVAPPINPMTLRPLYPPVKSLHLGVVSSDLGTPGSVVPWCANPDAGDDGRLNPIRHGLAMRAHPPWNNAPPGRRPARCRNDPNQFPSFLRFDRATSNAAEFRDDVLCNAYLSSGGCDLAQPLEAAYRALVVHDAREGTANASPHAGFVRSNAVLGIVVITDGEDGSVRDCRYAEPGVPCDDATSVFDAASTRWASPDVARRFYDYVPGSAQDPTWPLDRYIDVTRPNRGFTSLKPGRPDLVIFSAIAGVPIQLPTRMNGSWQKVDWSALLGTHPDGSDGYVGTSAEGPVSMRQRNTDPACPARVVPACRREGSAPTASCDPEAQYHALPSRRVAAVARRFAERYNNGTVTSICRNDSSGALTQLVERIQSRLVPRCIARLVQTAPAACEPGSGQRGCVRARCALREVLPAGVASATACSAARGRTPGGRDPLSLRDTCVVRNLAAPLGEAPPAGREGFYYTALPDPSKPECTLRVAFSPGAELLNGARGVLECLFESGAPPDAAVAPSACE